MYYFNNTNHNMIVFDYISSHLIILSITKLIKSLNAILEKIYCVQGMILSYIM